MTKKVFAAAMIVAGITSITAIARPRPAMVPMGTVVCMNLAKANATVSTPDGKTVLYTVNPGGNPNEIQVDFPHAMHVFIGQDNNLSMIMDDGETRTYRSTIYQIVNGKQKLIAGNYRVLGANRVQFQVGKYDSSLPLQIEATLGHAQFRG